MPPPVNEDELHRWQQELVAERLAIYKQDLCNWFNRVLDVEADPSTFVEALGPGVLLLDLALAIQHGETSWQQREGVDVTLPVTKLRVRRSAKSGTFDARDNVSQFIAWARRLGIPDDLMFETNDLVMEKDIKQVIYCLMEVARCQLGVEPPRLVKMERSLEDDALAPADAMDVDALDSAVRALLAELNMDVSLADTRDDHGRYFLGQERPVFVRLLDGDLLVPLEGDWITLRHYLRLIDGDYKTEVNRVLRRCRTVAQCQGVDETLHESEGGDVDGGALVDDLWERMKTRESQFSEQLSSLTRGLEDEQQQGKQLEQRVADLQREKEEEGASLEKAQNEIRTLRKHIARERFARASQFALANVRKRASNIATLKTAALTLQRLARATNVFDSKEEVVAAPPVTPPAMTGSDHKTQRDADTAAREATDDAVVSAGPELVDEQDESQQQQQQQQQHDKDERDAKTGAEEARTQSRTARQADDKGGSDTEAPAAAVPTGPAPSLHEQRRGVPPEPLLIPTGNVDDSFLFDDPGPHQPTPPRYEAAQPRRHSMLPRVRISSYSVEDTNDVRLDAPAQSADATRERPGLVRSPAQYEPEEHVSASAWNRSNAPSYGATVHTVRSRSSPLLLGSHGRLANRHGAYNSQYHRRHSHHHAAALSARPHSPHEQLQGFGEDAILTTRDGRRFRVVGVKEIKTIERRLTTHDGQSGPAFQTRTTTRRLNAAEVQQLGLLPKARRLHAGIHSSQVAARGDQVQYAPTPRVSVHMVAHPGDTLFNGQYHRQQHKGADAQLTVHA